MYLIAAVDNNWNIGYNGQLLESFPEDFTRFKYLTLNSVIIMGRRTYESLPVRPLANRLSVVISANGLKEEHPDNVIVCKTIEDAIYDAHNVDPHLREKYNITKREIYVIGGAVIYNEFLKRELIDKAYITHINKDYPNADVSIDRAFFDNNKWMRLEEPLTITSRKDKTVLIFDEYYKVR